MKIHIDDKYLALLPEDKNEELFIKYFFTYQDLSKVFQGGKYNKNYIKNVSFAKLKKDWYITDSGFLKETVEEIRKLKFKVSEVEDKRTRFDYMKKEYSDEELGKYFPFSYNAHQIEALRILLKSNRGLAVLPTSAGKSFIFFAFIKMTQLPTLLLVNKITLANQLYDGAKEFGIEEVGIWNSNRRIAGKNLMIATIGSVLSLPSLACYKVLLNDECHNASAKTFQDLLSKVSYPVQFGFSATPDKGDKFRYALIRRFLGSPLIKIKAEHLIENKVMAKPIIYFVKNIVPDYDNWPDTMVNGLINNRDRNSKIVDIITRHNLPSLVLVNDVKYKQGEKIKAAIEEESDKRVVFLSGENTSEERDEVIRQIENNEIDVIVGTSIFNEGISIKNIHLFINAAVGKSTPQTLQKIGRSLRMMDGKVQAIVYDFVDEGNKYSEKHSTIRKKLYMKEGYKDITVISL